MQIRFLGREDPLEEGMAIYSSILAWRIPQTEEPGGLQSNMHTVRCDGSDLARTHAYYVYICYRLKNTVFYNHFVIIITIIILYFFIFKEKRENVP